MVKEKTATWKAFRAGDPPQITPKFSHFFNYYCLYTCITVSNRPGTNYGHYNVQIHLYTSLHGLVRWLTGCTDVPNNFPLNHSRPQDGDDVQLIQRASDTLVQGGGVALELAGGVFVGWVNEGEVSEVLALGLPRSGRICRITRTLA